MLIYQEFIAMNEELAAFNPQEKLRYAVHEIMIRLKDGEIIRFVEMSEILKKEFKIDISPEILKEIFDRWDKYNNPDYSVFKKEDKNWIDAWAYQGYVKRKARDKQSFGKHRKKDYTTGGASGYWKGNKWIPYDKDTKNKWNWPYNAFLD